MKINVTQIESAYPLRWKHWIYGKKTVCSLIFFDEQLTGGGAE